MQTFSCRCGNPLFFENTHCLACESEVGWCPACCNIVALEPLDSGGYRCTHENCGTALMKCHNYAVENVCNRMVVMADGFRIGLEALYSKPQLLVLFLCVHALVGAAVGLVA
ncbi:MAG: zinc-ribbon domain-containing protein, partial [Pseudomonadota bacterium]|nr:zinc-ribbon domain-containing protein [Pseudomonadota bacterium]